MTKCGDCQLADCINDEALQSAPDEETFNRVLVIVRKWHLRCLTWLHRNTRGCTCEHKIVRTQDDTSGDGCRG
jgi:hypothetical protein